MKRLVVIVSERARTHHKPVWRAVMDRLLDRGIAGATATRGLVGFGPSHTLHEDIAVDAVPDEPVTVEAFDDGAKLDAVAAEIEAMIEHGLFAIHDVNAARFGRR